MRGSTYATVRHDGLRQRTNIVYGVAVRSGILPKTGMASAGAALRARRRLARRLLPCPHRVRAAIDARTTGPLPRGLGATPISFYV